MDRIEDKIGRKIEGTDTNFADRIVEHTWFETVVREINQISLEIADKVERQTVNMDKGTYKLHQREAPFSRLLSLEIGSIPGTDIK